MNDNGDIAYDEIYQGRCGRKPMLVRVEGNERNIERLTGTIRWLAYVATALLISLLITVGGMVFEMIRRSP